MGAASNSGTVAVDTVAGSSTCVPQWFGMYIAYDEPSPPDNNVSQVKDQAQAGINQDQDQLVRGSHPETKSTLFGERAPSG